MIQCGSLPLVPEYLPKILTWQNPSLKAFLHHEERRSLFTVGTGRSSEWGTGLIADQRLGYLIFFLEDALKLVILVKQK